MSLIDKARESQVNSYFKLEEDYQSLVDHAQALERQLAEAREEEASLIKWLDQERQDWGSSEKDSWNPYHRVLSEIKEQG